MILGLAFVTTVPELGAQEDRLEERVNRDSWFQNPATDERRDQFRFVVETLSSPKFDGRRPGSQGGRFSSDFITQQFAALGLSKAGDPDAYRESVGLRSIRSKAILQYSVSAPGGAEPTLKTLEPAQYVAWSDRTQARQTLAGTALFVGYGVRAPEFQWDDYRGLDVKGRIVVMLTGDPPVPLPGTNSELDPKRFDGIAMTRHGRWDHKLALAAQMGASAVVLVHNARAAGYPFAAVKNTFGSQRIYLSAPSPTPDETSISIWMSKPGFESMLNGTNLSLDELEELALAPRRESIEIPVWITAEIESQWQDFQSHNVIGRLDSTAPLTTPTVPQRPIVLMAHWDHLGPVANPQAGASTYFPGAADNASGIAQMLDIAKQLKAVKVRNRPIEFVALTAEESGLLGARYFVQNRLRDKSKPVPLAGVNIDIANVFGRARDVEVIGLGLSSLDQALTEVARDLQRHVSPDYAPNIGRLFRSDQYEFIRNGIPAIWIRGGRENRSFLMRGPITQIKLYLRSGYHQTGDSIQSWWNVDSALEDANLIAAFVSRLSNTSADIAFNPGSPYQR